MLTSTSPSPRRKSPTSKRAHHQHSVEQSPISSTWKETHSRIIHHPIPLTPIRPERTRLGYLHRRPSATPTRTLPVPTTAPATNSQQQFKVPQSIQPRTSAAPHQPPARAHVNGPRSVQLIEPPREHTSTEGTTHRTYTESIGN
jgi:hypothetical protein